MLEWPRSAKIGRSLVLASQHPCSIAAQLSDSQANGDALDVGRDTTFGWDFTSALRCSRRRPDAADVYFVRHRQGCIARNGFMFVTNNPYNDAKHWDNNIKYEYMAPNGRRMRNVAPSQLEPCAVVEVSQSLFDGCRSAARAHAHASTSLYSHADAFFESFTCPGKSPF